MSHKRIESLLFYTEIQKVTDVKSVGWRIDEVRKKRTKGNDDAPKRSPGRPKASKNKKTLILEARRAKQEKRMKKDG